MTPDEQVRKSMAQMKAFKKTVLGRALGRVEKSIAALYPALSKRPHAPGTEEVRRQMALRSIKSEQLRGRALEDLSVDELELLRVLFGYWQQASSGELTIAVRFMELQLAGVLVATGEVRNSRRGDPQDVWTTPDNRTTN